MPKQPCTKMFFFRPSKERGQVSTGKIITTEAIADDVHDVSCRQLGSGIDTFHSAHEMDFIPSDAVFW
jgi:hypothetical protein